MKIDAGGVTNNVLDATEHNAEAAMQLLSDRISSLIGRDFFGRTTIQCHWEAGQLTFITEQVERTYR